MKKTIFYLSTIMIVALLCLNSGCIDDDKSPLEQLPPATQEGLNTFGCLVNGEVWMPEGNTGMSNLDISYDSGYGGGLFDLATYRILGEDDRQYMYIYSANVKGTGTYELDDLDEGASTFSNYPICVYDRDPSVFREGSLTLTRFDLENQIISGTFEFTLAKSGCDTLKVTDGRFDMKI